MLEFEYTQIPGDFDGSGALDAIDINLLSAAVRSGQHDAGFDLTDDGLVDQADREEWVEQLRNTSFGDANLDGQVTAAADGGALLASLGQPGELGWEVGDFDGDGTVTAAGDGALLIGSLAPDTAAVPEPNMCRLAMTCLVMISGLQLLAKRSPPQSPIC